jgi:hypothetical protein
LELAENYGDEFDGFITGAPAIWHDRFRQSDDWPWLVNEDDLVLAGYPTLSTALWNATTAVVVAACQANNPSGAVGYLDDPRACRASARRNICGKPGAAASPNCLTTQQAAAVDKIWAGPHKVPAIGSGTRPTRASPAVWSALQPREGSQAARCRSCHGITPARPLI